MNGLIVIVCILFVWGCGTVLARFPEEAPRHCTSPIRKRTTNKSRPFRLRKYWNALAFLASMIGMVAILVIIRYLAR